QFPAHILGTEVGADGGEDNQAKKPRFGYQVVGEFTKLPAVVERPVCVDCQVLRSIAPTVPKRVAAAPAAPALADALDAAVHLGRRVARYLAVAAREDSPEAVQLWPELVEALRAWAAAHGNPAQRVDLRRLAKTDDDAARFVAAFTPAGALIAGLQREPVYAPRYRGRPGDVVALASHLWATERQVTLARLLVRHHEEGGAEPDVAALTDRLEATGEWVVDAGEAWPHAVYLTGDLWPKYDRMRARIEANANDGHARFVAAALLSAIAPVPYEDIDRVSPRAGWVPLSLVEGWVNKAINRSYGGVRLYRGEGLLQIEQRAYETIKDGAKAYGSGYSVEVQWFVGWVNHDKVLFNPTKRGQEEADDARLRVATEWEQAFRAWIDADPERAAQVAQAYNRAFRGYVAPDFSTGEALQIARWDNKAVRLHAHQVAGVRRLIANRGGGLAFDVGVGKSYAACATVALARQQGWARRPIVCVPNSIVWQWRKNFARCLPD
ncbi:MAG: hypothetical protein KC620_25650, partial [Myxococcales bacterium]|nr:hypothetical protein [Myxococcales bacterium]